MTATLVTARRLLADDSGATAIEYALLAALIAGMIIAAVVSVGQTLDGSSPAPMPSWSSTCQSRPVKVSFP